MYCIVNCAMLVALHSAPMLCSLVLYALANSMLYELCYA
jgi:hypothetical protein